MPYPLFLVVIAAAVVTVALINWWLGGTKLTLVGPGRDSGERLRRRPGANPAAKVIAA